MCDVICVKGNKGGECTATPVSLMQRRKRSQATAIYAGLLWHGTDITDLEHSELARFG